MVIYLITNSINGKCYIGQTTRPVEHRWSRHVTEARRGSRSAVHLAIRKYGAEAFTLDIIGGANSMAALNDLEVMLIAQYGTLAPHGYNLASGGRNCVVHDETRAKMSAVRMGMKLSDEHRANIRAATLGKPQPKLRGRPLSAEHRAKLSAAHMGIRHSAEMRAKVSAAVKGRPWSEAHRRNASLAQLGKKASDETRAKLRAARKLRPPQSAEDRAKKSASHKARHARLRAERDG